MLITFSQNQLVGNNPVLALITANDAILLWQDGVYLGIDDAAMAALQQKSRHIFALEADVHARGIASQLRENVQIINFAELVNLTVTYHPQLAC